MSAGRVKSVVQSRVDFRLRPKKTSFWGTFSQTHDGGFALGDFRSRIPDKPFVSDPVSAPAINVVERW